MPSSPRKIARRFRFKVRASKWKAKTSGSRPKGKRIHTGQSEELNRAFAKSFTEHFDELAAKYPIYAELRNLADLALVGSLLREEEIPEKTGWHLTSFGGSGDYPVMLGRAPKEVESVVNFRVIGDAGSKRVHSVVGVSGGVSVKPASYVKGEAIRVEDDLRFVQGRGATQSRKIIPTIVGGGIENQLRLAFPGALMNIFFLIPALCLPLGEIPADSPEKATERTVSDDAVAATVGDAPIYVREVKRFVENAGRARSFRRKRKRCCRLRRWKNSLIAA